MDDQLLPPSQPVKQHPAFSALVWLPIFILILIGVGYAYYSFSLPTPLSLSGISNKPSGTIYLSLVKNGDAEPIGVYGFDVANMSLSSLLPLNASKKEMYTNLSISDDESEAAVVSLSLSNPKGAGDTNLYLLKPDNWQGSMKSLVTVSPKDALRVMHPAWSPSGASIAVMSNKYSDATHVFDPNSWDMSSINVKTGKIDSVGNGAYPTFVSDSQIVALKSDGLYLFSAPFGSTAETSMKIWGMESGLAATNMQFDISADKKIIAWTLPKTHEVMIIDVASWSPFSGSVRTKIPVNGFWPKFSPDGRYLALEQIDNDDLNQELVMFDLKDQNFKKEVLYPLTDYKQTALFITDWK